MNSPNVVWITLDSVRSGHTTIDGYERDTTPTMARLGERGAAFRNCFAHSKSTLPSSGAILTGMAPTRNTLGVEGNVLPDAVPTVAERFSAAGYSTACLSRNSYVSSETGLDRGFDRFQWLASDTIFEAGASTLAKYLLNIRRHSAGFTTDTAKHASPFLMNEVATDWLDDFEAAGDPFFLYCHYNEPHRPYYPPLSYLDEYADDIDVSGKAAAEYALDVHYDMMDIVADGCELSEEEVRRLIAMYDAEIAYTDEMVGRLLSYVESLDLGETVVVVTADHGELFGEHGLLSHRYVLTDAVTRVPLVVDGLDEDLVPDGDDLIQHADVMRTLLAVAGADDEGTTGVDLREDRREFAVSQREPVSFDSLRDKNPSFDASPFHTSTLTSLRTPEFRYQESDEGADLFEIPDEVTDVSDRHPEERDRLAAELDRWIEEFGQPLTEGARAEFSGAVQEQLRDLGYMD